MLNSCYRSVQNLLSSHLLPKNGKIKNIQNYNFACSFVQVCKLVSPTRGRNTVRLNEPRALRRISRPKIDEVTGGLRRRLQNLYSATNIRMTISRMTTSAKHEACMGEKQNAYNILTECGIPMKLGRLIHICEEVITSEVYVGNSRTIHFQFSPF
jgi:hypothetical protein